MFTAQASTDEEEALLCLALLMGYNALIYTNDIETRKQTILERSWKVLEKLSPSLLKCQLLTYCYGEVFDDLFEQYLTRCEVIAVKTSNMGSLYKLTYHITLKDQKQEKKFIDELRCRNGNLEISIMQQEVNVNEL